MHLFTLYFGVENGCYAFGSKKVVTNGSENFV
jgi:hypothetical protein